MGILSIFDEGNTDVSSPMELKYMRKIRMRLLPIDSWPTEFLKDTGEKSLIRIPHKLLLFIWTIVTVSQLDYIRLHINKFSFVVLGNSYITVLLSIVSLQRISLIMSNSYRELIKTFVQEMHLFFNRSVDEFSLKTFHKVHKYCTIATSLIYFQMWLGIVLFNVTPLLVNILRGELKFNGESRINGTLLLAGYLSLPFDYVHWLPGYWVVSFCTALCCFVVCTSCSMVDNLVLIVIGHLWGHLDIFESRLRNFPMPASKANILYSDEESPAVMARLRDLIIYHNQIFSYADMISVAFGPTLALYLTYHQLGCCILLLEISQMSLQTIALYGSLTIFAYGGLILYSVSFEVLGSKSEGLIDAVYSLPWECMRVRERRVVLVFLIHAQRPIYVKALGMLPIGVKTMASIIKNSVSYFVMLRTFE